MKNICASTIKLINVGIISYIMTNYREKLAEQFFLDPMRKFGVRELSRKTKMDTKTTMKYLNELAEDNVIVKKKEKGKHVHYEANISSRIYRHEKSEVVVKRILKSGVIEFLEKELRPEAIVLFGSMSHGSYHKKSDADIFVQADRKRLDLDTYDKKIGHPINLLFEKDLKKLGKWLLSSICDGITLSGQIEVPL